MIVKAPFNRLIFVGCSPQRKPHGDSGCLLLQTRTKVLNNELDGSGEDGVS
jgi:hypothetical protein